MRRGNIVQDGLRRGICLSVIEDELRAWRMHDRLHRGIQLPRLDRHLR
jgi:hypothetical protein